MPHRVALVPVSAAVALVLAAGCGSDPAPTAQPSATPTASSSALPSASPSAPPTAAGADQVVTLTYRGGVVSGAQSRVRVRLGSTVRLVVSSDRADEVHLHGYDRSVEVPAGGTAQLTFRASIPGVFEAELEHRGVLLVRLQVQ